MPPEFPSKHMAELAVRLQQGSKKRSFWMSLDIAVFEAFWHELGSCNRNVINFLKKRESICSRLTSSNR